MKIGIVLKLVVLAVFLAGICGGMYLAYIAAENGEWAKLAAGIISASLAALVIGTLVPWIAHFDGSAHWEADEGSVNIVGSIKVGLFVMLVMSGILFTVFGIWAWVEYGRWIAGVASIGMVCGNFVRMRSGFHTPSNPTQPRHSKGPRRYGSDSHRYGVERRIRIYGTRQKQVFCKNIYCGAGRR